MTDTSNTAPTLNETVHYCAVHPERDTELRCNRCDRYMCIECAVRTPVGYTCKECVRGQEDKFFEGTTIDYIVVALVAIMGGAGGGFVMGLVGGFFWLSFIIAPTIGASIAQLALSVTGRRRGRQTGYICAGGVFIGGLVAGLLFTGLGITTLLYLALATSSAFASMKVTI